eukprot:scaffold15307_cov38-Cyclotella_meneghiniana.AAC.2
MENVSHLHSHYMIGVICCNSVERRLRYLCEVSLTHEVHDEARGRFSRFISSQRVLLSHSRTS